MDETMIGVTCSVCGEPFTPAEWEDRHSDDDGEDCHERCCPICADERLFPTGPQTTVIRWPEGGDLP